MRAAVTGDEDGFRGHLRRPTPRHIPRKAFDAPDHPVPDHSREGGHPDRADRGRDRRCRARRHQRLRPDRGTGSSNSQAADGSGRATDDGDDLAGTAAVGTDDTGTPIGDPVTGQTGDPHSTGASGPPDQALPGLCRAWLAGAGDNPGRAGDGPVLTLLVDRAGGPEEVTAYCDDLVAGSAEHPAGPPAENPGDVDHPGGPLEDHPGGGRPDEAPAPPEHPVR